MGTILRSLKELSQHNEQETYRGDARDLLIGMGNQIIQQRATIEKLELTNQMEDNQHLLQELLNSIKPITKALTSKIEKVKTKENKDEFLQKFRASQLLK